MASDDTDELLAALRRALAERVSTLRDARDWSQEEAAGRAGIDQSVWCRIERNEVDPRLSTLIGVQRALDLESLESLFGDHPSRAPGRTRERERRDRKAKKP